jgi:3-hydroxyacyl-CoA dehydrogenase
MVEQGKRGVKSGEGFYRYPAEKIEERIRERDYEFLQKLKCPYLKDTKKKT